MIHALNVRKLVPLIGEENAAGELAVWRSLELNPYALFEKQSLDAMVASFCKAKLSQEQDCVPLLNLHLSVNGLEAHDTNLGAVVLGEPQLVANKKLALVTLILTVNCDAAAMQQLRTMEFPVGRSMLFGYSPVKDDGSRVYIPLATEDDVAARIQAESELFERTIPGGTGVYRQICFGFRFERAMLMKELCARDTLLSTLRTQQEVAAPPDFYAGDDDDDDGVDGIDLDAESLGEDEESADEKEEDDESEGHAALEISSDGEKSKDDAVPEDDSDGEDEPVQAKETAQLHVNRANQLSFLRLVIAHQLYKLEAMQPVLLTRDAVVGASRRISAEPLAENPLKRVLFSDANCTFYFTRNDLLAPAPLPPPPPVEALPIVIDEPVVEEAVVPETPAVIPRPMPQTWLDVFYSLDLADISLYELETYARTRLGAMMVLLRVQEAKPVERTIMLNHWTFRSYPRYSGAHGHILALLPCKNACRRENLHQTIGTATLAMVAHSDQRLRTNLGVLEALMYEHQHPDRNDDDNEIQQCCDLIEQFWQKCDARLPAIAAEEPELAYLFERVARDWARELDELHIE